MSKSPRGGQAEGASYHPNAQLAKAIVKAWSEKRIQRRIADLFRTEGQRSHRKAVRQNQRDLGEGQGLCRQSARFDADRVREDLTTNGKVGSYVATGEEVVLVFLSL